MRGLLGVLGDPQTQYPIIHITGTNGKGSVGAMVDVGLLGRFDETNVAVAHVAVITNIGHDHTDFEGDWRRKIADEKVGIVKPESFLVVGERDPDLVSVFEVVADAERLSVIGR